MDKGLTVKFVYSEKAKEFCKIFTLLLFYVVQVSSKVKISQNVVAFSEYVNFTKMLINWPKIRQTPQNLFAQIFCPSPKVWNFIEKMLH